MKTTKTVSVRADLLVCVTEEGGTTRWQVGVSQHKDGSGTRYWSEFEPVKLRGVLADMEAGRVPKTFSRRARFFAWLGGISLALALVGCGPTSRTAYLRDAASAHLASCAAFRASPMNTFWCEQDARAFCKANGLETNCWEGR